jgi:hypothetical protein
MTTDLQLKVINETFGGDKDAYDRAWSKTTQNTLQWSAVIEASSLDPSLNKQALDLFIFHFGYLPSHQLLVPYIPVISSLIKDYHDNHIDYDRLLSMSLECMLALRNHIVILHSDITYPKSTYQDYAILPIAYKDKAKQRFASFLGYQPLTETSIQCELAISSVLSSDIDNLGTAFTELDSQMFLIIKYREILLTQGKSEADLSIIPINNIKISNNCFKPFTLAV